MAWVPTNAETTLVVTADTACVPSSITTVSDGVLAEVLSGAITYTIHDAQATPDDGDFVATIGDQVFVAPANRLRMARQSADSCVKLQGYAGAGPFPG